MSRPRYDWWGYVKGMLRRYQTGAVTERERQAVDKAIQETLSMDCGEERLTLVGLIYWKRTHTLEGAALQIPVSWRTAAEWHRLFIRAVAKHFGLMD